MEYSKIFVIFVTAYRQVAQNTLCFFYKFHFHLFNFEIQAFLTFISLYFYYLTQPHFFF